MKKKLLSLILSVSLLASAPTAIIPANAEANTPVYQTAERKMEELDRGLIAVKTDANGRGQSVAGVYLSWRLLGTESLENQAFDIYRDGKKIYTTGVHEATNYMDTSGTASNKYKVVKAGEDASAEPETTVFAKNYCAKDNEVGSGNSLKNSFTYTDIPIERPDDSNGGHYYTINKDQEGGANDASIGDLDGDNQYEIVLKWDPTNSKDAAGGGTTGHTYIDGYEIDPSNTDPSKNENGHLYKWRIDLGPHVRSGAHENPFLVYDFDGDGKSEVVSITGPGAIDGIGKYVTEVGDTEEIRKIDNTVENLRKGKNIGPEFYTVFDGETGAALCTTEAILIGREDGGDWGDAKMNRSSRYLAAAAYLDGVHPSIVMCRGYYNRAAMRAYSWDGTELSLQWDYDSGNVNTVDTLYGQGNHNLSVADIDNDGKDEIVYGSACLDDDGRTVMGNTRLGHGDAMHTSDFNNDGIQEVFSVKEDSVGFKNYAVDLRVAATGEHFWEKGKLVTSDDNGRGVMDNIDDAYAAKNPNALALGWDSGHENVHDLKGDDLKAKPAGAGSGSFDNFLVYWDADLSRELLDANIIQKYDAANGSTKRFYGPSDGYTLVGGSTNNYTKRNPSLVADIWGDWREEVIMPTGKGQNETPALRIFTSTFPTEYRLTTLMHDSQYRMSIVWQNVGYNQPPHTSYYIGSAALATDENGNKLNYLAPKTPYTKVVYDIEKIPVTGFSLIDKDIQVEKNKLQAIGVKIEPENATKKGAVWTSSDENVAKVKNGVVTGVGIGEAVITATSKDGGFSDTCKVTVFSNPVEEISLSDEILEVGMGYEKQLTATVKPDNATDKSVVWSSSDPYIASVEDDGTVKGINYGNALITAKTKDGNFKAYCVVKVKPIDELDMTGEDVFVSTTNDNTSYAGTATGGKLTLSKATAVSEFHKDFTPYESGKVKLSFRLNSGGAKENNAYVWKLGHTYKGGIKFIDTNGKSILDIYDNHENTGSGTGVSTMYSINDSTPESAGKWTKTADGSDSPFNRSQIRWIVNLEFNYDDDLCIATVSGCDSNWSANATYQKEFKLNGAKFKTLQYYTAGLNDYITANPEITDVSYVMSTTATGNAEVLYERGGKTEWTSEDLTDWVQDGKDTAALEFDSENKRIWYHPVKPGAAYSAVKAVSGIDENALVTYDTDWYFGNAVSRDGNFEYIQFGDKLCLGWTNGYNIFVSTDGGTTWKDNNGDGTPDSIFTGENKLYTKNVKVIFNVAKNEIQSLIFDGKEISEYNNYALGDGSSYDKAVIGFKRAGAPPEWEVPNGISRIRVSQFIPGEEKDDPIPTEPPEPTTGPTVEPTTGPTVEPTTGPTVEPTTGPTVEPTTEPPVKKAIEINDVTDKKAAVTFDLESDEKPTVLAVLYDKDGNAAEIKLVDTTGRESKDVEFDNSINDYKLKVFAWNNLSDIKPLCESAEYSK